MAELDWSGTGPRSTRFDDVYFQLEDGLAESQTVFLQGCHLEERFATLDLVRVAELGFGTGLNILATLDLWRRTKKPPGARLRMVSIEAYLMTGEEAARALSAFPDLAELASALLDQWPQGRTGLHRLDFPELGARLDLWIGAAETVLPRLSGGFDAWFLDGFAPSKNPAMWSPDVLSQVARLSADGCRLATFTVAGEVRRTLAELGFTVEKKPGFGRKRERLEAWREGEPARRNYRTAALIGAGIAGAALAHALTAEGLSVTVFEAEAPASGGSGNPAGLVSPRLDAGFGPNAELHASAFERAVALYRTVGSGALIGRGAVRLSSGERDESRFDRIAAWDGFSNAALVRLDCEAGGGRLGEPTNRTAIRLRDALTVSPAELVKAFLGRTPLVKARIARIEPREAGFDLIDAKGRTLAQADAVFIAAGAEAAKLVPELRLKTTRGQVTWVKHRLSGEAATWGGYLVSTGGGLLFGATHQRDRADLEPTEEDDAENLENLRKVRPLLAEAIAASPFSHRASMRAFLPDHLPMAGEIQPGLFVLGAFGGRGLSLAPLLAEHLAALASDAPPPLPRDIAGRLDPQRALESGGVKIEEEA